MYIKFKDDNVWETKQTDERTLVAFYRDRVGRQNNSIVERIFDEREYRLWKTYTHHNENNYPSFVYPMIYEAFRLGFDIVRRISDSKFIFERL